MNHPDFERMVGNERWMDRVEAAGYYRLIQEAEQAAGAASEPAALRPSRLYPLLLLLARVLSALGGAMVNWSCRLQYRYARLSPAENSPCS